MPQKKPVVLQLKNVSKIYQLGEQTIRALNQVDFVVEKGDFISIMGPSGSGKSTFLQVASMLAHPSKGHIFLNGQNVTSYNVVETARLRNSEIGFIFQQFNLLKKTSALDNVALPLLYAGVKESERRRRAQEMLEKVGLGERLHNSPAQLSGGQQQRVAIARALINNPAIIFADEPTGNLDSKSGKEIQKILKDLNKEGKTIIMVTHEIYVANIARRQIELMDGIVIRDNGYNKENKKLTKKRAQLMKKKKEEGEQPVFPGQ
jgi:putative ABC transport system ATP-binding protein